MHPENLKKIHALHAFLRHCVFDAAAPYRHGIDDELVNSESGREALL